MAGPLSCPRCREYTTVIELHRNGADVFARCESCHLRWHDVHERRAVPRTIKKPGHLTDRKTPTKQAS
jgi:transposase-like protein